ncbi:MAG: hypothetical protein ACE5I3_07335 [Phycisphaerae bacterium]
MRHSSPSDAELRSERWVKGWLDRGNFLAIQLRSSDGKARLNRRKDDGKITPVATSTNSVSLTSGTWNTAKAVVDDDQNDPNNVVQRLCRQAYSQTVP